eukprot:CAMPEP_0202940944 /NCGR_PEP_ID=MMETSP1395-20130829/1073_1 /ASSEMBLY_ACC=CAM_ASM_000871 /TAXON_ID=5961 /ORGANISM="Blepharisma japonicum, Strain Stock R1072" /LENGTH=229 /DNA_ID=CAMNT_0049635751 /DNA_START=162 /DNA_END=852 /DNA_ORIENTATION=-
MEINAESSETAQYLDVFNATSKALSDLLLTKPLSEKIMLGENDQCSEVLLSQAIKIEGIAADLILFVIPHEEKMHAQICEGSGQTIKSVALYINIEKLKEFDKANQVKVLCKTVIRAIYEKGSKERKGVMKDIDNYQVVLELTAQLTAAAALIRAHVIHAIPGIGLLETLAYLVHLLAKLAMDQQSLVLRVYQDISYLEAITLANLVKSHALLVLFLLTIALDAMLDIS